MNVRAGRNTRPARAAMGAALALSSSNWRPAYIECRNPAPCHFTMPRGTASLKTWWSFKSCTGTRRRSSMMKPESPIRMVPLFDCRTAGFPPSWRSTTALRRLERAATALISVRYQLARRFWSFANDKDGHAGRLSASRPINPVPNAPSGDAGRKPDYAVRDQ